MLRKLPAFEPSTMGSVYSGLVAADGFLHGAERTCDFPNSLTAHFGFLSQWGSRRKIYAYRSCRIVEYATHAEVKVTHAIKW